MLKAKEHTVGKKETIEKIAKNYGFKDWKEIWKYPKNKLLVSQRKKPAALAEGDKLMIPALNDKEREEYRTRQRELNMAIGFDKFAADKFAERAEHEVAAAEKAEAMAKEYDEKTKAMMLEMAQSAKSAKNWSDGVDLAAAVIGIVRSIGKIASMSKQASEAIEKQLTKKFDKIYGEMVGELNGMTTGPVTSEGQKAVGKYLTTKQNDLLLAVGSTIESWGKMTSPSFWGTTVIAISDGKSWSEAVTYDYQKEMKDKIVDMDNERKRIVKSLNKQATAARAHAANCEKEAAACEKRIKACRKEKDGLDKQFGG